MSAFYPPKKPIKKPQQKDNTALHIGRFSEFLLSVVVKLDVPIVAYHLLIYSKCKLVVDIVNWQYTVYKYSIELG